MTPQERLKLYRQHQEKLRKAVGDRDSSAENAWPVVYDLWAKYYRKLLESEWSTAINQRLPPKEVHAHLIKVKRDLLRLREWNTLMPLGWKHCWVSRRKQMPEFRKYLNRRLTAEISHWVKLHDETALRKAEPTETPQWSSRRLPSSVVSPDAARRLDEYLREKNLGATAFATSVGITDRTLRTFRQKYKIGRRFIPGIAREMGTTPEKLLTPFE